MITIPFIHILYIITQEYNDYYTIHSNIIHNSTRVQWLLYYDYYNIHSNIIHNYTQEYNDYYTIHSNIIHNNTRVQWLLYYSFKYYT